jgi:hypothetical protein
MLLHSLDNGLTDGGKVVSLIRQPPFTLGRFAGLSCLIGSVDPQSLRANGSIRLIEEANNRIGKRSRDLLAYTKVSQPHTLRRPPPPNNTFIYRVFLEEW